MKPKFKTQPVLFCFSPPVMLATIIIEIGVAVSVLARYLVSTNRRLVTSILVCLAGFQLSEFNVCGLHGPVLIWSRLGYILITLLPPLGFHLGSRLVELRHRRRWVTAAYASAAGFIVAFAAAPTYLNRAVCTGNYVIFNLTPAVANLYTFWYIGLLLVTVGMIADGAFRHAKHNQRALLWLAGGYLAFMVPSYVIFFIWPSTHAGLPSIMCGFAVTFAVMLGLKVAPEVLSAKH